jgi:hypothetical protein
LKERVMKPGLAIAMIAFASALGGSAGAQNEQIAPYAVSDANAGTSPITDPSVFAAFHGQAGVDRIVASLIVSYHTDPARRHLPRRRFRPVEPASVRAGLLHPGRTLPLHRPRHALGPRRPGPADP